MVPSPCCSSRNQLQVFFLDQPLKLLFHSFWHRAAPHQHSQFHVDRECLLSEVGRRQEQPLAIGNSAFDVQDADVVVAAVEVEMGSLLRGLTSIAFFEFQKAAYACWALASLCGLPNL